ELNPMRERRRRFFLGVPPADFSLSVTSVPDSTHLASSSTYRLSPQAAPLFDATIRTDPESEPTPVLKIGFVLQKNTAALYYFTRRYLLLKPQARFARIKSCA